MTWPGAEWRVSARSFDRLLQQFVSFQRSLVVVVVVVVAGGLVGLWAVAVVQPSLPHAPRLPPPYPLPATSPSHLSRPRSRISPEQQKPSRLAATEPVVSLGREAKSQEPRAKTQKPRARSHEPKRQRKLCRRKHLSIHVPHRRQSLRLQMHAWHTW